MIIKELHLNNFGKFRDFKINFLEGFNLIYGENESGKTTILAFIIMMLYGNSSKSSDISQNDRKKYKPWQSSSMNGSMTISKNGIDYRIERYFNNSNYTDEVEVFDLNTGKKLELANPKQPGLFFFDMGYDSFKKTLFISSESMIIDNNGKKDELTKKLVNIVTTGEEDLSYKKVLQNLDEEIERYSSKSGHKGLLVETNATLDNLKLELEDAKNDEKEKLKLLQKIEILEIDKRKIEDDILRLKRAIEFKYKKDNLKSKKSELELSKERLKSEFKSEDIKRLKEQFDSGYRRYNFDILSLLLAFIALFLGFALKKYFYIAAVILFAYSIYKYFDNNKRNEEIKRLNQASFEKYEHLKNANQNKIDLIENDLQYIQNEDRNLSYEIQNSGFQYFDLTHENLNKYQDKLNQVENKIIEINSTAKERFRGKRNQATILKDLEDKNVEILKLEKEFSLLLKTKEFVQKSFNEVENDFSKKINEKASSIISEITKGKYNSLFVSNDFNISILDTNTNNIKEWKYLSNGTIDQLYLSLRLAITELIIEKPSDRILLLDDIFIRYDNNRLNQTISLLDNNKSKFSQLIAFTCHNLNLKTSNRFNIIRL